MIHVLKDVRADFDQVGSKFTTVPFKKDLVQFTRGQIQSSVQKVIDLSNQLHIPVFDAVVHHLDIMPGSSRSHVGDARLAVSSFCGDRTKNWLDCVPRFRLPPRHDSRSPFSPFFASRYSHSDKMDTPVRKLPAAPLRILEERVTAVNEDIAILQGRDEV